MATPTFPLLDLLACPACHGPIENLATGLRCTICSALFPIRGGVADLRPESAETKMEYDDWARHWDPGNQDSLAQRFFSFYRKAVFARTVAWFIDRFFPEEGVFAEAGSGTAETSMRIDKKGGRRILVAMDLFLPVVSRAHPVMDVRIGADCFHLPLRDNALDGLWNVGVMEHFTHDLIDAMLREFLRVLRRDAPILLLWPATDSLPQRGLEVAALVIGLWSKERVRFHPDEISRLRSSAEGREVLARNGFEPVFIDPGLRSLMAFKTLVGRKRRSPAGSLETAPGQD
jgi:SAM-dependent methyltransferase